jgi:hypothetical protein
MMSTSLYFACLIYQTAERKYGISEMTYTLKVAEYITSNISNLDESQDEVL